MEETVNVVKNDPVTPSKGTAGVESQVPGQATTVSGVADASGGIGAGNLIQSDIDQQLFEFKGDDTPMMQLMLRAKKVKVNSPIVEHYMIDEPRSSVKTAKVVTKGSSPQFVVEIEDGFANIVSPYTTLLVKDVDGYTEDGQAQTPGKELMLFVTGVNENGNPICRAVNGPRTMANAECTTPDIPAGSTLIIMSKALYETQKEVEPDLIVPQAETVYLQKRGMNQIVSDYYEAQKKKIPFGKAIIAEAAITKFKVEGNRTLYASRKGRFKVKSPKTGAQDIFTTEGVRYQVKKEFTHKGKWTIEEFIALAKVVFTGEDVPKSVIWLAGKNLLENIQCIDYSMHPEIQITSRTNKIGWVVTAIHTVFGDFELKHDPTLDRLKWSNSGFIVAPDRLVHYQYSAEHRSSDRVEGEEATREAILVWDALALKGTCHVWVNGEGDKANSNAVVFEYWDDNTAPESPVEGHVYYLLQDCPGINAKASVGEMWVYKGSATGWVEYSGDVFNL